MITVNEANLRAFDDDRDPNCIIIIDNVQQPADLNENPERYSIDELDVTVDTHR